MVAGGGCDSNLMRLFSRGLKIKSLKENYHTCLLLLRYCVSHSSRVIIRQLQAYLLGISCHVHQLVSCSHRVSSQVKLLAQFYGRSDKKTGLIVQVVLWKDCGGIEENIIYIDVLAHRESLI